MKNFSLYSFSVISSALTSYKYHVPSASNTVVHVLSEIPCPALKNSSDKHLVTLPTIPSSSTLVYPADP